MIDSSAIPFRVASALSLSLFAMSCLPSPGHAEDDAEQALPLDGERISEAEVAVTVHREGTVSVESRFRIGVRGGSIKRGPVLRFLTVFAGPGGLILDKGMEIEAVLKNGEPEPFHLEKSDGFFVLYVGSSEVELDHGDYTYTIRHRSDADWHRSRGEFSAAIDVLGSLPAVPIDRALVRVVLPEGVLVSRLSPAVTGFESVGEEEWDRKLAAGWKASLPGSETATVETTRALSAHRSFFVNLTWPSATFANRSLWLKVMAQHPRIPIAAFSAVLLLWALILLLSRAAKRRPPERGRRE